MTKPESHRSDQKHTDGPRPADAAKKDAGGFTAQESGASGGPPPTSKELAGRTAGAKAGQSKPATPAAKRPGVDANNASQNEAQGSADADADHESGDKSEGVSKRMD
ncbi:MAG: hypothetical protein K2Q20_02455 [Phycisphaerales bacterium]|nr:hypothetical protein [Phycisphaerales bacterium]